MATFTGDRATNLPARYHEKGVFCAAGTYEFAAEDANDVFQLINVPAGVTVLFVILFNDALGASTTLDVGYGDDEDYFIAAKDSSAAAITFSSAATARPLTFAADDTLDVKLEGAAGTGTVTLLAFMTADALELA